MFAPPASGRLHLVNATGSAVGAWTETRWSGYAPLGAFFDGPPTGRRIAIWLAVGLGLIVATAVAAGGIGPLGAGVVLLPAAMIAYSVAMTAAATAAERRESAAIERANDDLRRFVLGETSVLIGIAQEQQRAIQAGYDGAIRAALELSLTEARAEGDGRAQTAVPRPAATGGW
jgi:hypothetical protein